MPVTIPHPFLFVFREDLNMDIGSILYNIKYRGDGIKIVSEKEYVKRIAYSRDTKTSSGLEYQAAQFNRANDYNETARELLALYH